MLHFGTFYYILIFFVFFVIFVIRCNKIFNFFVLNFVHLVMKNEIKFYMNNIGVKWCACGVKINNFDVGVIHDLKSIGVGVYYDRWVLSKQLTIQLFTLYFTFTWYKNDNEESVYKF